MANEAVITLRVPGTQIDSVTPAPPMGLGPDEVPELTITKTRRFRIDQHRGAGDRVEIQVAPDEVVEIVFDDGSRIWTSADRLTREILSKVAHRDLNGVIEVPKALPVDGTSRGLFGKLVLKTLTFFGVNLEKKAARKLAKRWEKRTLKLAAGNKSELYRSILSPAQDELNLEDVTTEGIAAGEAHLLFLHGTASSTGGSFGNFWTREAGEFRQQLHRIYDKRILAFEHRTLTKITDRQCLAPGGKAAGWRQAASGLPFPRRAGRRTAFAGLPWMLRAHRSMPRS